MGLTRYKLGELIEQVDERNLDGKYGINDVRGISIQRIFIDTKANMKGVPLKPYKIVKPDSFAYVTVTSRNGEKITLAHNTSNDTYIVSTSYVVFRVSNEKVLLPDYLYIYFNRSEFDRFARFNSWGSARETFTWEDMCDIEIDLPPVEIQKKYVDIYKSMFDNQKRYERGLGDLKLACEAYIENLRNDYLAEEIGKYLCIRDEQNSNMEYTDNDVMGVSQEKTIIPTKANTKGNDLSKFTIIYPFDFVYNPRNGVAVGLNLTNNKYIISWNNTAFYIADEYKTILKPEYLLMWLSRSEWDRKVKYDSWGSSTEVYSFDALCDTKIPIPPLKLQESVSNIFRSYEVRKNIAANIKFKILDICPVLIKGSLEEAKK